MKPEKILVTGGLGLIGSTLISYLNQKNKDTKIICVETFNNQQKLENIKGLNIEEYLSLNDFKKNQLSVLKDIDIIYHLGACSSTTENSWEYLYEKNYKMTLNLVNDFINLKKTSSNLNRKMVIASSASTYGNGENGFNDCLKDIEKLKPLNSYGLSKQLADLYLKSTNYLSEILSLKFFNIFGVNEFHKGEMRSIAHWGIDSVIKNKSIRLFKSDNKLYKDGEQVRDFLDANNAVLMMDYLVRRGTGIHNIGCGEPITWNEMAKTIIEALEPFHGKIKLEYVEMRKHLVGKYQYYTCAEMKKNILPKELLPNKTKVLNALKEICLEINQKKQETIF